MKLNEKLKELRRRKGFNQEQIAKHLDIDQTMVSRIESDERNITLDMLYKLSELYLCTLESLLDDNLTPEIIAVPFRSKDATGDDMFQISKANKIILNMKEMLDIKECDGKN